MVDITQVKLGKAPARHDPRTLRLANYLNPAALPPIPAKRAWSDGFTGWGMLGNSRYGDCVEAGMAHGQQVLAVNNGRQFAVTDADVLKVYQAITGFDPITGANDNGTNILDALRYWKNTGINGHKIGAFAAVDPKDAALMRAAIDLFGFVYIGVLLPISAQAQSGPSGLWDVVGDGRSGNATPGSWGGHCIILPDYDTGYKALTWGYLQPATERWIAAYCDEAYAVLSPDWFGPNAQAPSGFDLAALTRDLAIVSGQPDPGPPDPTPPTPTPPTPTPPPMPDPLAAQALYWQMNAAAGTYGQYMGGDTANAKANEDTIAGYAAQLDAYLKGLSAHLPEPPAVRGM